MELYPQVVDGKGDQSNKSHKHFSVSILIKLPPGKNIEGQCALT